MKISLDLNKNTEQNASIYYEKAKKAKKKIKGAEEAIKKAEKKLSNLKKTEVKKEKTKDKRKKEWYEKFRWLFTSTNFLVIGGRDATTNEIIIKKHTENDDLVFHTDMAGSPFFVIKTKGKKVDKKTLREAADATATFSKAWKLGIQSQDVFYVKPEQVSKKAQSGEYLTKGAFMIYGKTNYVDNKVNLALGIYEGKVMAAPLEAVKKHCDKYFVLEQGDEKVSDIAKKIKAKLNADLDEIIRALPSGTFKITKFYK